MYRDADYDKEDDQRSIASYPEGLREEYRYLPHLANPVRRTNSLDNVARFQRYFDLVRKNCGRAFEWRHYTRILHDGLRRFKAPVVLRRIPSTPHSEASAYFTASEATVKTPKTKLTPRTFRKLSVGMTNGQTLASPFNSGSSLSVCEETKNLARDIRLKVDKITKNKTYETKVKKHSSRTDRGRLSKYRSQSDVDITRCGAGDIDTRQRQRPTTSGALHH
ncbi:hypothetical protein HNY73_003953 [Argiope bruennichi]|uniref:Uncharacterized protein n=1 Tax=Argiope bruennichi TaxID=94029 RepID=A0A8T0FN60_ARGBR|nr:hypothetical protein HNY73_003953 [Argiope bruennichi]